jgi:hypothetical protein
MTSSKPPGVAHQVMSMNSGPNPRMRSIRSNRFCRPCKNVGSYFSSCVECHSELTCAVRGGKYSNDHHILSVLVDDSIFLLILMAEEYVRDARQC